MRVALFPCVFCISLGGSANDCAALETFEFVCHVVDDYAWISIHQR